MLFKKLSLSKLLNTGFFVKKTYFSSPQCPSFIFSFQEHDIFFDYAIVGESDRNHLVIQNSCMNCSDVLIHYFYDGKGFYNCNGQRYPSPPGKDNICPTICKSCFKKKWKLKTLIPLSPVRLRSLGLLR